MTTIALIDDHVLIRNALKDLINRFDGFEVVLTASNGQDLIAQLQTQPAPDIALIDINMPVMNGFATASFLTANFPSVKIIALSVNDDDESIIKMLRCGAVAYLLKDAETLQLKQTLQEVHTYGYYHNDLVTNTLMKSLRTQPKNHSKALVLLNGREAEFLKLACSELTYKEIADEMCLAPRTIDGYREQLFDKLSVKSRVGLVLFAIRNGVIQI